MKAIAFRKYGPPSVLHLEEITKPTPKENEVLIKIYGTTVNSGDCRLRRPDPQLVRLVFGLTKPRNPLLGVTLSGEIEAIGNKVTKYKVGDQIYGMTGMKFGTYAEYRCLPETATIDFVPKSCNVTEVAAIPFGGMTAYHFLTKCNAKKGESILIYGASGSVGTSAIQIAKAFGLKITAVCSSANTSFVSALGADRVLNYDRSDFNLDQESFDIIFDTVGKKPPQYFLHSLKKEGALLLCDASAFQMLWSVWKGLTSKLRIYFGVTSEAVENLRSLSQLLAEGKIKPIITKTYGLEDMVTAHSLVETGHKVGNILIQVR